MSSAKKFQCDVCESSFKQPSALNIHKRIHNGERPHVCDFCGKAFTQAGTLTIHRRLHSKERPYFCDVCQRTFTNSSALTRHKRTHSGEKPHGCDVCPKRFAVKGGLKIHKRMHTNELPYECDVCQKRFRQAGQFKYHKQTHSQEVFDCKLCKKVFKHLRGLRGHRLHYDKMPHKCDLCQCRSFGEHEQLVRHQKTHSHLFNSYFQSHPSKSENKSESETPNLVLKKYVKGASCSYVACEKKSCNEGMLHYHKTGLDVNNRDNFEQDASLNTKVVQPNKNVEKEGQSKAKDDELSDALEKENSKQIPKIGETQSNITTLSSEFGESAEEVQPKENSEKDGQSQVMQTHASNSSLKLDEPNVVLEKENLKSMSKDGEKQSYITTASSEFDANAEEVQPKKMLVKEGQRQVMQTQASNLSSQRDEPNDALEKENSKQISKNGEK